MATPFGHVDLRVEDIEAALSFYEALLPALGFTERYHGRDDVDRLAEIATNAGATAVAGPKEMPYGPDYYAVYFADPSGNRFEIYHRLG